MMIKDVAVEKSGFKEMNVVIPFHKSDQGSAALLLELLMLVDEGVQCTYYLQYGDPFDTLTIDDTLKRFRIVRNVVLTNSFPDIAIPDAVVEDDPNSEFFEGRHFKKSMGYRQAVFGWVMTVYKYIHELDYFLILEPDSVVLRHGWLSAIFEAWKRYDGPIFGHLKCGWAEGRPVPSHWAGSSVYDGRILRKLPLRQALFERRDNPWWRFRDDCCFWNMPIFGPVASGFDMTYDFFLYYLYWKETTGSDDPLSWPVGLEFSREDLIFCDWNSHHSPHDVLTRFLNYTSLYHGVKNDLVRHLAIRYFSGMGVPDFSPGSRVDPDKLLERDGVDIHLTYDDLNGFFRGSVCFVADDLSAIVKRNIVKLREYYSILTGDSFYKCADCKFEPTVYFSPSGIENEFQRKDVDGLKSIKFLPEKDQAFYKNRWNTFFTGEDSFVSAGDLAAFLGFDLVIRLVVSGKEGAGEWRGKSAGLFWSMSRVRDSFVVKIDRVVFLNLSQMKIKALIRKWKRLAARHAMKNQTVENV